MDGRLIWTDCDEAGDYVVPNVVSPRDLVSRPDNMDETVLHTRIIFLIKTVGFTCGPLFLRACVNRICDINPKTKYGCMHCLFDYM